MGTYAIATASLAEWPPVPTPRAPACGPSRSRPGPWRRRPTHTT